MLIASVQVGRQLAIHGFDYSVPLGAGEFVLKDMGPWCEEIWGASALRRLDGREEWRALPLTSYFEFTPTAPWALWRQRLYLKSPENQVLFKLRFG